MEIFEKFLAGMDNTLHRARTGEVLCWVAAAFPGLTPEVRWNQPMFTDHGTFIIGFSASQNHLAVAPERAVISRFSDEITKAGYDHSKELIRIPWNVPVDHVLLEKLIRFNMLDKAECKTFWRR